MAWHQLMAVHPPCNIGQVSSPKTPQFSFSDVAVFSFSFFAQVWHTSFKLPILLDGCEMETMIGQQEAYVGWAAGVHLASVGALCVSVFMLAMVSGWMDGWIMEWRNEWVIG
jgi:hypothetical protein